MNYSTYCIFSVCICVVPTILYSYHTESNYSNMLIREYISFLSQWYLLIINGLEFIHDIMPLGTDKYRNNYN